MTKRTVEEIAAERQRRQRALLDFVEANGNFIYQGLTRVHGRDLAERFLELELAQRTYIEPTKSAS